MRARADLGALVTGARPEELPTLIGALEAAKAAAWARLAHPGCRVGVLEECPQAVMGAPEGRMLADSLKDETDRLVSVDDALRLVGGDCSRRWLLRATRGLRFRRDFSRKTVRFEEGGLRRWIATKRP